MRVANPLANGTTLANSSSSIDSNETVPVSGGSISTTVTSTPVLALSASDSPDPVGAGANLTYTLSYSNTGNANATGVVITDTLPGSTSFVSATGGGAPSGGTVTWTIGNLVAGASGSVQLVVRVANPLPSKTIITNAIYGIDSNETPVKGGVAVTTTVSSSPGLGIFKKHSPSSASVGADLTYTITFSNTGTADATGVVITDQIPLNTTFVSATAGGTLSAGMVSWTIGTLSAGTSVSVQDVVRVASALSGGTIITSDNYLIDSNETPPVLGPPDLAQVLGGPPPTVMSAVETATRSVYIMQSGVHQIQVDGGNFQEGAVLDPGAGISPGAAVLAGPTRFRAVIRVDAAAALGWRMLRVTNPDLGSGFRDQALKVIKTADVNRDCRIDGFDLNAMARAWNVTSGQPAFIAAADLDGDGYVGPEDLADFIEYFGLPLAACP